MWIFFLDLKGEFAFIFLEVDKQIVWFGRDIFGRRSLIFECTESSKDFRLTSTSGEKILHCLRILA